MSIIPTDYLPNYTSSGTSISLSLTDLTALSAAECDIAADGGDLEELAFALNEAFSDSYAARVAGSSSLPTGYTLTKTNPTGLNATSIRQGYTHTVSYTVTPETTDQV